MQRAFSLGKGIIGIVIFTVLGLWLLLLFDSQTRTPSSIAQQPILTPTRFITSTVPATPPVTVLPATPIPTLNITATVPAVTPTLSITATIPAVTPTVVPTPPPTIVLEGLTIQARKAAFLRNKDLWVVESGRGEQAITTFGDVEAIFGWNQDGTKLLLGRGRKKQAGDMSDTTELWLLEWSTRQARQLTTGSNVHIASWSPVDDRVAYCEQDNGLKVIDLTGKVLNQVAKVLCVFTWSPDGTLIAAETFVQPPKPGFYIEDTRLVVINLKDGTSIVLAELGAYYGFVWSLDGKRFLFQWSRANRPLGESLWHLADVAARTVQRIDVSPASAAVGPMRSPHTEIVAYSIGDTIYVMDFTGKSLLNVKVKQPTWAAWAPNGSTLVYRGVDGKLATREFTMPPSNPIVGGGMPAPALYNYQKTEFYFSAK